MENGGRHKVAALIAGSRVMNTRIKNIFDACEKDKNSKNTPSSPRRATLTPPHGLPSRWDPETIIHRTIASAKVAATMLPFQSIQRTGIGSLHNVSGQNSHASVGLITLSCRP